MTCQDRSCRGPNSTLSILSGGSHIHAITLNTLCNMTDFAYSDTIMLEIYNCKINRDLGHAIGDVCIYTVLLNMYEATMESLPPRHISFATNKSHIYFHLVRFPGTHAR